MLLVPSPAKWVSNPLLRSRARISSLSIRYAIPPRTAMLDGFMPISFPGPWPSPPARDEITQGDAVVAAGAARTALDPLVDGLAADGVTKALNTAAPRTAPTAPVDRFRPPA